MSSRRPVFVYGSLLAEEVLEALLGHVPELRPAALMEYQRYRIRNRVYPAITGKPGGRVLGKLMLDLTTAEEELLDVFEGEEYVKVSVTVHPTNGSGPVNAWVYAWAFADLKDYGGSGNGTVGAMRTEVGDLKEGDGPFPLYGQWDYDTWRSQVLSEYIEMCRDFKRQYVGLANLPDQAKGNTG
mmetsp:Transcript_9529/g.15621  ORF Transcript_9529/g.15621 Transcript_9529/m.15621 type:complete len:184 (-) Transcript_9529:352-903(-)|eukprot:CAMPEP_0184667168 /NCGR_PEP_ID=MMETSP0308-20130426/65832_1 /TAXON_ID=38269 /ORGANISM="Gloeochaete witrockiana, Strain SAG 46.84" /LENGTH=183 /DNA_ID=CAMNT_0027112207 /DNA_START=48 /DNA_END=599 /DNA_ORIENTATION=+